VVLMVFGVVWAGVAVWWYLGELKGIRGRLRMEVAMGFGDERLPFCFSCGYDLRGSGEGRCPECGGDVTGGRHLLPRSR
jgi:hypothetical protein